MARSANYDFRRVLTAPGPVLAATDFSVPSVPPVEPDSIDHWDFGGSAASLVGLKSGNTFAPIDPVNPPTYNSRSMSMPYQGLTCPTVQETANFTAVMTFDRPALASTAFGVLLSSHLGATTLSGLQLAVMPDGRGYMGGALTASGYPAIALTQPVNAAGMIPPLDGQSSGDPVTLALVATANTISMKFDGGPFVTINGSAARAVQAGIGIDLGMRTNNSQTRNTLNLRSLVLWSSAKTEAQLDDIFERLWLRGVNRGYFQK